MQDLISFAQTRADLTVSHLVLNPIDPLIDAGHVAQAVDAAIADLDAVNIALFSADQLYDYRAQRPIVTYSDGKIADFVAPELYLNLVTDMSGQSFLYLGGQEPDFNWEKVAKSIISIVERFQVRQVYSLAAMPGTAPHTRPADMLLRSTAPDSSTKFIKGQVQHYGALPDLFEFYAEKNDIPVMNIRVRVPFYIAKGAQPFISGALAAIKMIANLGGPRLPLGDLEQLEDQQVEGLNQILAENPELQTLLDHLEEDYDSAAGDESFVKTEEESPAIPSAEEIGQAAERFLAAQTDNPLQEIFSVGDKDGKKQDNLPSAAESSERGDTSAPRRRGRHHY